MPERMVQLIREHHIPSVWTNNRLPADCVYPDDLDAFRRATRYLLDLGHRRIAYVTFHRAHHYSHADRYGGYEQEMRAAGLEPRSLRSDETIPREARLERAIALLKGPDRPTAIITWEKDDVYPFMLAAAHLGLAVPGDISLMTAHAEATNEMGLMVAHMRLPAVELGREAVRMLLAKIATPDTPLPPKAIPFTLVPGVTTGAPRA
jgi:LacI family transcriptional regulator